MPNHNEAQDQTTIDKFKQIFKIPLVAEPIGGFADAGYVSLLEIKNCDFFGKAF